MRVTAPARVVLMIMIGVPALMTMVMMMMYAGDAMPGRFGMMVILKRGVDSPGRSEPVQLHREAAAFHPAQAQTDGDDQAVLAISMA